MQSDQKTLFRHYLEKWRPIFHEPRKLVWMNGWLDNGYCPACRYCCGPQDSDEPFPMGLLPGQISSRTPEDFYMLNNNTACLTKNGCKSLGAEGCRLERPLRPVACGLFPIVLANGRLYLYKTCPAVIFNSLSEFAAIAEDAAKWLDKFSDVELRHLSLNLGAEKLAEDYIDMGIRIF